MWTQEPDQAAASASLKLGSSESVRIEVEAAQQTLARLEAQLPQPDEGDGEASTHSIEHNS